MTPVLSASGTTRDSRRLRSGLGLWLLILLALACARVQPLSGGPPDDSPPVLQTSEPPDSSVSLAAMPVFRFVFDERIDPSSARRALRFYPHIRQRQIAAGKNILTISVAESLPPDTTIIVVIGEGLQDLRPRNNKLKAELWHVYSTGNTLRSAAVFGRVTRKGRGEPRGAVLWEPVDADTSLRPPRYPIAAADAEGLFRMIGLPPNRRFTLRAFLDRNDNLLLDDTELVVAFPETLMLASGERRSGLQWNLVDPREAGDVSGIVVHQTDFNAPIVVAFQPVRIDSSSDSAADSLQSTTSDSLAAARRDTLSTAAEKPHRSASRRDELKQPLPLPVQARSDSPWNAAYERLEPRGFARRDWQVSVASPRGKYALSLPPGIHRMIAFVDVSGDSVPGLYVTADSTQLRWEPLWIGHNVHVSPGGELKLRTIEIR